MRLPGRRRRVGFYACERTWLVWEWEWEWEREMRDMGDMGGREKDGDVEGVCRLRITKENRWAQKGLGISNNNTDTNNASAKEK